MKRLFYCLVVLVATPLWGQNEYSVEKLASFKSAHPQARFFGQQYFDGEGFFDQVGTANSIFGTVLANGATPVESAWNFYREIEGIYVENAGDLVEIVQPNGDVLQGAMWNADADAHRFYTFRFQQQVDGVPVFRSGIGFLVRNEEQFPVVMSSNNLKEMNGFDRVAGAFAVPKATNEMIRNTSSLMNRSPIFAGGEVVTSVLEGKNAKEIPEVKVSDERLVIWSGVSNVRVAPEFAVAFMAERGTIDSPFFSKHLVVAAIDDGEILYSENQIHADVNGTISGEGSELLPIECVEDVPFALPYASVEIVGGNSTFADENGVFTIPDATNGTVTVRSSLSGEFFEVLDDSIGLQTPFLEFNVASPGSIDILHNPEPNTEFAGANVNCYVHANIVRDYVLEFEPTFPIIGTQTLFDITSNNDSLFGTTSCNAFYSGNAINFIRNAGNCVNTSIPDVVYHEYGHHLIAVTGNGQGQMGEGTSDTMGVLIQDNPELAEGWTDGDCSSMLRSAENFRSYPCSGGIHDCGQLISGCIWDTINEIRVVDPDNALEITGRLFVAMLIVRGQMVPGSTTIDPLIPTIMLELDDDDGDIFNGTPHATEILAAFGAHNMMPEGFDASIEITFPEGRPAIVNSNGGVAFQVDVAPPTAKPAPGTGILHLDRGNGFEQFPMTVIDDDSYAAVFPETECLDILEYYVSVQAENGVRVSQPEDAPASVFEATSATQSMQTINDSFDTDLGWTVEGDAFDGQWERGIPNNGDRGDPENDAEDFGLGFCYVTDNGNTPITQNTDVDLGSTILISPLFDATTSGQATMRYFRWFSNGFGDDAFVTEISNDGGSTWVNVETIGPSGNGTFGGWVFVEHDIAAFVEPTDTMRVRFIATDIGASNIVEAGIDGFVVDTFECSEVLLGDVNLDGVVNLLDVTPFVELLANSGYQVEADINQDGEVDLLDVNLFVDLLTN